MSAKEKTRDRAAKAQSDATTSTGKEPKIDAGTDLEDDEPASAKSMPKPGTSLAAAVKSDVGKLTVSLLGEAGSAPVLADVEKFNKKGEGDSRTPLMTVVQAVLAKAGGSMQIGDLAAKLASTWNRPFPASPYTDEEIIYLLVRNSDSVRVS